MTNEQMTKKVAQYFAIQNPGVIMTQEPTVWLSLWNSISLADSSGQDDK